MSRLELRIPPVAVFLVCGVFAWGVRRLAPGVGVPIPGIRAVAACAASIGVVVGVLGIVQFLRARTTLHPTAPEKATTVVTTGLYAFSRNPMYLGLVLLLTAFSLWLAHPLALLSVPAFVTYMNRFQIGPEERVLLEKFGEPYAAYLASVRRWI